MKRIVCLCVILICSISFSFAQGAKEGRTKSKGGVTVKKKIIDPQIAEAEKAWNPFWLEFKKAIVNRDKNSLKKLMAKDFPIHYIDCDCDKSDLRDFYFCCNSCCDPVKWWETLSWMIKKNVVVGKIWKENEGISRGMDDGGYSWGYFAGFEYSKDGKWYFTGARFDSEE